jgi:hypothetical protein
MGGLFHAAKFCSATLGPPHWALPLSWRPGEGGTIKRQEGPSELPMSTHSYTVDIGGHY